MNRAAFLFLAAAVALAACGDNQTPLPDRPAYASPDGGTLACVPNLDGRIEADELEAALGIPVGYLVSPAGVERSVDLMGAVVDGQRVWDFGTDYADDAIARLEARAAEGQWFAGELGVPSVDGLFTTPVDAGGTTLGIYRKTDEALFLVAVASAQADPPEGRTLLVYDAPIALYRFPIEVGATHVSTATVSNGIFFGLPYAGRDVYEVEVKSAGRIELPDLAFDQALRVDVRVTVEPAVGASTSRRQVSFLFECFGEVARATSRPGETVADFTTAAEVRRLSLE